MSVSFDRRKSCSGYWLDFLSSFGLAPCQEKRKALNSLVHQRKSEWRPKKKHLNSVLKSSSFIHFPQSFLGSFRRFMEQGIFKYISFSHKFLLRDRVEHRTNFSRALPIQ